MTILIEAASLALLLASSEPLIGETSCAKFYSDDMIDRIECVVLSNPEAFGPDECFFIQEVEVELSRNKELVLAAKTDCRRSRIFASVIGSKDRACRATINPAADLSGKPYWEGRLTAVPREILVAEGYYEQKFEITLTCED